MNPGDRSFLDAPYRLRPYNGRSRAESSRQERIQNRFLPIRSRFRTNAGIGFLAVYDCRSRLDRAGSCLDPESHPDPPRFGRDPANGVVVSVPPVA